MAFSWPEASAGLCLGMSVIRKPHVNSTSSSLQRSVFKLLCYGPLQYIHRAVVARFILIESRFDKSDRLIISARPLDELKCDDVCLLDISQLFQIIICEFIYALLCV